MTSDRIASLRQTSRSEYVIKAFNRNEGMRNRAQWLIPIGILLSLAVVILGYEVGGEISIGTGLIAAPTILVYCIFRAIGMRSKANELDMLLMSAYPDWKELIEDKADDPE